MKKLSALFTALILLFSSVAFAADTYLPVADTPFNTDEYGRPVFTNLGEALRHNTGGLLESDYYITIVAKGSTYYRMIADYDENAKTLWEDYIYYLNTGDIDKMNEALRAYNNYNSTLPVRYDSEFTADPIEQAELDLLAGKTVREVKEEGYTLLPFHFSKEPGIPFFMLEKGFFRYSIELNESSDTIQECADQSNYDDLTIKSVKWSGSFSSDAYKLESVNK